MWVPTTDISRSAVRRRSSGVASTRRSSRSSRRTQHVGPLRKAAALQPHGRVRLAIVQAMVGARVGDGMTTLDAQPAADRTNTLIKIDVEGAEADVIAGAASWLLPGNLFVIEVHRADLLDRLRRTFQSAGLELDLVEQQPLPILGREERDVG